MSIHVLLVDDHAVVRRGLRSILTAMDLVESVDEAATGRDGIHQALTSPIDVVVLDVELPDLSGIEAMQLIHEQRPKLPVVMFSMHADRHYCVRALRAGATGYVTKQGDHREIAQAVASAARGRRWLSPDVAGALADDVAMNATERDPHECLSPREFEVLRLVGAGVTPTEIGQRLGLSVKTVSSYRTRVLEKLSLTTTAQMIRYAVEHHLVA